MGWLTVVEWLQKQGTLTIVLTVAVAAYLVYRGIIRIPGLSKKKKGNPHVGCEHAQDAEIRISKMMDYRMKIDHIINIDRVRLQMDVAELVADDIVAVMKKHYLKLLKGIWQSDTGLVDHPDFRSYEAILKAWRAEMLVAVRHMMRENNIPLNDAEFEQYADVKINKLIEHTTQFLNDYYSDAFMIKREVLYDSHLGKWRDMQSIVPTVREKLYGFFRQVKKIYQDKLEEVKCLEAAIAQAMPTTEDVVA